MSGSHATVATVPPAGVEGAGVAVGEGSAAGVAVGVGAGVPTVALGPTTSRPSLSFS